MDCVVAVPEGTRAAADILGSEMGVLLETPWEHCQGTPEKWAHWGSKALPISAERRREAGGQVAQKPRGGSVSRRKPTTGKHTGELVAGLGGVDPAGTGHLQEPFNAGAGGEPERPSGRKCR